MKLLKISVLAAVALCAVATISTADLFPQATSPSSLRLANGLIWDGSTDDWIFDGEFTLRCTGGPCSGVPLANIEFDLALAMVRPDGLDSHSHTFTNFVATAVTVVGDDLVIDGSIDRGTLNTAVEITVSDIADRGTFTIDLIDDNHIIDPVSGVTVRSR